jgi:hypothetical protein
LVNKKIEKYSLFSEDFRGLPDGWHNLRACNFLVGENSTGKSSFLQLIQLMDSREHLMFFDICGIVEGIDTAFDVCSRITAKKETTIGFLLKERQHEETEGKEEQKCNVYGRLATYKKVKEDMELVRLTMVTKNHILRMRRSKDRISYRFDDFSYDSDASHLSNGTQLQEMHFKGTDRFTQHQKVDWQQMSAIGAWYSCLTDAISGSAHEDKQDILHSYPPLRCLHHGPLRAKTRRLYHGSKSDFSSTGEHVPYLLKNDLSDNSKLNASISNFGKASGLFDQISVTKVRTAIKDKPFALQIEKSGSFFYVDELGFGVGQVLPIVVDIALTSGVHTFLIQQPELHLHPKAQAALGDVFHLAAENGGAFVIETHSDFIIDRYRLCSKASENSPRAQIVYFEKDADGVNKAYEIELNADGTMGELPDSYREFFVNESIDKFEKL